MQVRTRDDVLTCARHINADSLAPIFLTSSVTGEGLDLIRLFYNLLPQRYNWCVRGGRGGQGQGQGGQGRACVVRGAVWHGVVVWWLIGSLWHE